VSGEDTFGHNRVRHINNRGEWFPKLDGLASPAELSESEIGNQIERVWRQVLKFDDKIDPQEDFFDDLGGHSLLLQEVKPQLEQAFRREIPTEALFRHSTLNSLTQFLLSSFAQPETASAAIPDQSLPTLLPEGMSIHRAPVPG
jgi:acyl carrier protein